MTQSIGTDTAATIKAITPHDSPDFFCGGWLA
jgi:hypothetical protein